MDEPLSPINPMKCIKTYSKAFTNHSRTIIKPGNDDTKEQTSNREEIKQDNINKVHYTATASKKTIQKGLLTTKDAVKLLLENTLKDKVCRYCLKVDDNLSNLDELITVGMSGGVYSIAIQNMIASFHPVKVETDPNFPSKICENCLSRTISSYLFSQQCDQTERALRDCFEDIYEKVEKLDPLERPKKRGRQKLKLNYNVINAEHKYVIDYAEPTMHIVSTIQQSPEEPKIQDYECLKCSQVLPDMVSLLNHVKTHPKNKWFICRLCGKLFPKLMKLKKHFRQYHNTKTNTEDKKIQSTFKCDDCGVIKNNYQEFIQHIEKHKFKTVLKHIVTCNMDKLCTICFDKGCNMIGISKAVDLHGGFEELTGERTVQTMIAATLPEKNNKYQELIVANQANVISLRKKNYIKLSFIFTSPFIIENLNSGSIFDDYIFLFNEPQKNLKKYDLKEPEIKKMKYETKQIEIVETLDDKINKDICSEEKQVKYDDYNFIFSNPLIIDLNGINKGEITEPIVEKYSEKMDEKRQNLNSNECEDINIPNKINVCDKTVDKYENEKDIKPQETKEKIDDIELTADKNISVINKDKSWQCKVCLTNNKTDRVSCFCCEMTTYNDVMKFNFKPINLNTETTEHIANTNEYTAEIKTEHILQPNVDPSTKFTNNFEDKDEKTETDQTHNMDIDTEIVENTININLTDQHFVHRIGAFQLQINEIPQNIEAMDIEENPTNTKQYVNNNLISQNINISNNVRDLPKNDVWNKSFQFTVGIGPSRDKGKKRPNRNISRAFHK